jgi:hypothetical protein
MAVLDRIDSGAEMCRIAKPAVPPQHLVSYVMVVDGPDVLLVDQINAGLWLPSCGHALPGEHPRGAAQRDGRRNWGLRSR